MERKSAILRLLKSQSLGNQTVMDNQEPFNLLLKEVIDKDLEPTSEVQQPLTINN